MLKRIFSLTGIVIVIFAAMTIYYYFKTPGAAMVVSCDELPDSLSKLFSADEVVDRVVDHLQDMVTTADSGVTSEQGVRETLDPRPVPQKVFPVTASSKIPSPIFDHKFKGMDLNYARRLGIYLKARKLLELRAVGTSKGGWRLIAVMKVPPQFSPHQTASAPRDADQCSDYEACAKDAAEETLEAVDPARLLNYYIKLDTKESNRRILDLYRRKEVKAEHAEDLVAWGNAFYALGRYDDALQKFQEAIAKDQKSCAAQLARGFVYYDRPHGNHMLRDLKKADENFQSGVKCDPKNKYAQTDLCSVQLIEKTNNPKAPDQFLTDAQDHCEKALSLDPRYAKAAVNFGLVLYQQGKHPESIKYFEDIAQQYPTDSSLFLSYGYCLYREFLAGNNDALDEAIEETQEALKQNSANYAAASNLGFFHYDKGDYSKALNYWETADPLRGDDVDPLAGRALGLFKVGRRQEAVFFIKKAIDLNSRYKDPKLVQAF